MFILKFVSVSTVLSYFLISSFAYAENFTIEMLNKLGKEKMVYSEKVISIKVNDEITWKSVDKGHSVEFIGMPDGVSKYKSKISKDAKFKFTKPGVYLYQCTPHKAMGMIGLVVVGNDKSNLDKIKKVRVYGKSKKLLKKLLKSLS
jgi:Plastocyanin